MRFEYKILLKKKYIKLYLSNLGDRIIPCLGFRVSTNTNVMAIGAFFPIRHFFIKIE